MESNNSTDSEGAQSEPWTMLEDSDIEVCDEPKPTEPEPAAPEAAPKTDEDDDDDFAKLRKHRQFIEQLDTGVDTGADLSWDTSDIPPAGPEKPHTSEEVCSKCSGVLGHVDQSKLWTYACSTLLALSVLAVASGLAYYMRAQRDGPIGGHHNCRAVAIRDDRTAWSGNWLYDHDKRKQFQQYTYKDQDMLYGKKDKKRDKYDSDDKYKNVKKHKTKQHKDRNDYKKDKLAYYQGKKDFKNSGSANSHNKNDRNEKYQGRKDFKKDRNTKKETKDYTKSKRDYKKK